MKKKLGYGASRRTVYVSGGVAIIAVLGATWAVFAATNPAPPPPIIPSFPPPFGTPGAVQSTPTGVPSVQPTLSPILRSTSSAQGVPAIAPTVQTTDATKPAFTEQDVRQYIATHPLQGKITGAGAQIVRVEFLPSQEVDAKYHVGTNFASDRLLCVATLSGTFAISAPPVVSTNGTQVGGVATLRTAYLVFDAHTGNLVKESVGG